MRKLTLASKSPRRKELLENLGLKFSTIVTDTDESIIPKDLDPGLYVRELALLKANAASKYAPKGSLVIGADTIVVFDGEILGKPKDREDAVGMLKRLSGKTHFVYTGIAVADTKDMHTVSEYEVTEVTFKELSDNEINYYVDNFNVLDKAGAYGIQEYASTFVCRINGDYFNVVGLPVCRLFTIISKEFGEEMV